MRATGGDGKMNLGEIELQQVQEAIRRILDARNASGSFRWSGIDQLRYEELCKRESELLRAVS